MTQTAEQSFLICLWMKVESASFLQALLQITNKLKVLEMSHAQASPKSYTFIKPHPSPDLIILKCNSILIKNIALAACMTGSIILILCISFNYFIYLMRKLEVALPYRQHP